MDIQTKHRKAAVAKRPAGRALLALAERKETPLAAIATLMALAVAALARSAFAGEKPSAGAVEEGAAPDGGKQDYPMCLIADAEPISPLDLAYLDPDDPLITGSIPRGGVAGSISGGPGVLDISRFFDVADPAIDLPDRYLSALPDIRTASSVPLGLSSGGTGSLATGGATGGSAGGGAAGGGAAGGDGPPAGGGAGTGAGTGGAGAGGTGSGGAGSGGGSGGAGTGDGPGAGNLPSEHAGMGGLVSFEELFARLAEAAAPFCPDTIRDITSAAIGDWVSQQELYRLRGGEVQAALDPVFAGQQDRTFQLLSDPLSREAFVKQHFPTADFADLPGRVCGDHYFDPAAEPAIDTETHSALL